MLICGRQGQQNRKKPGDFGLARPGGVGLLDLLVFSVPASEFISVVFCEFDVCARYLGGVVIPARRQRRGPCLPLLESQCPRAAWLADPDYSTLTG